MVTSGPGVTNAITPLADAFYDSTPLVLITGQIGTSDLKVREAVRQRGFQEVPTVALTSPIAKHSTCMMSEADVFREIPAALAIAKSNRPGPVVIDFPMDVQRLKLLAKPDFPGTVPQYLPNTDTNSDIVMVSKIAAAATSAKRPIIFLGHGALTAGKFRSYIKIADLIDARVVTSLLGIGSYDTSDSRWLGYLGHTGHLAANRAVFECDFLLVLGARLDVRQTGTAVNSFVPNGRVAWINADENELANPRVDVEWKLNTGVGEFCSAFIRHLKPRSRDKDALWVQDLNELQAKNLEDQPSDVSTAIGPRTVLRELANLMTIDRDYTVVTGVGCHQHWAARHLPYHPERCRFLTSGGHGTMGYDLPSAIGAAMVKPSRRVMCIVGDGSFMMNMQEMAALSERNLDVKIIILNNQRLGIVSQFQRITWDNDPTTGVFGVPDFVEISHGFGVPADTLEHNDDIENKLSWLWSQNGPALLNVIIDHEADVTPMLLAGQTMGDMWMGRHQS